MINQIASYLVYHLKFMNLVLIQLLFILLDFRVKDKKSVELLICITSLVLVNTAY